MHIFDWASTCFRVVVLFFVFHCISLQLILDMAVKNDKFCKPINMCRESGWWYPLLTHRQFFFCTRKVPYGYNAAVVVLLGEKRALKSVKNEKWKLIYIWTMLNMNDWLQSFFFSRCTFHFMCAKIFSRTREFHMSAEWCRRGPINVKKPQTKWQFQNANCTFCLLSTSHKFFFIMQWHFDAVVFTIVCDMQLFIGIVTSVATMMMPRVKKWTHLQI